MATRRQELAIEGELLVVDKCRCLRCGGALRPLRKSLPCADVRCIECARPAQVRTRRWPAIAGLPKKLMGAAWAPQAGLLLGDALHDLFVVLVGDHSQNCVVYALPASAQDARLFRRRDALPSTLQHAGQQAFTYELEAFWRSFLKIEPVGTSRHRSQVVRAFPALHPLQKRKQSLAKPVRSAVLSDDYPWSESREARSPLAFNVVRLER